MWAKLGRIIKSGAKIGAKMAPEVLKVALPQTQGLVSFLQAKILEAESEIGSGKGLEKKAKVMDDVSMLVESTKLIVPLLIPMIETSSKVEIDDDMFTHGVSSLIDGIVSINNSLKILPKG